MRTLSEKDYEYINDSMRDYAQNITRENVRARHDGISTTLCDGTPICVDFTYTNDYECETEKGDRYQPDYNEITVTMNYRKVEAYTDEREPIDIFIDIERLQTEFIFGW